MADSDGYLRFPAVHDETVVFVSEDDLWSVPSSGGTARRLTADLADVRHPAVSPDGSTVAFTSKVEGQPEVYAMALAGGAARRLTWLGDPTTRVRGFTPDGRVLLVSAAGSPFANLTHAHAVDPEGGPVERLPYGPVGDVAWGPGAAVVVGRNTADPARWKRYRGGTAGRLWVDRDGSGTFERLLAGLDSPLASPMWVGDRVWFLSDHEGVGNLYSCTPTGSELRRETDHGTWYARWATTDGRRVAYQHAGDIWLLDPATGGGDGGDSDVGGGGDSEAPRSSRLPVALASPRTQLTRRFVTAEQHVGDLCLHPAG
ncbi:MAG: S41 family peptidase, partial [Actinomycetes bacterium]